MKNTLIVVAGATAVGKTDFAVDLALRLNTEIISADSRQIYKEMNIATAKPDARTLAKVKHYFIGTHSITDNYNASKFETDVIGLLKNLFQKNDTVIMAGGSGLYIDAVIFGIDQMPDIDPQLRSDLKQIFEKQGIDQLRKMLKKLDPEYYEVVDLKNPMRLLKAIEITIQTGKKYSSFLSGKAKKRDFDTKILVLERRRENLYRRINRRVDIMMKNGLLDEARKLYPFRHLRPLQTVGYKELFDYLDGKTDLDLAVDLIKRNTRKYARKQISWFRRYADAKHINIDNGYNIDEILKRI